VTRLRQAHVVAAVVALVIASAVYLMAQGDGGTRPERTGAGETAAADGTSTSTAESSGGSTTREAEPGTSSSAGGTSATVAPGPPAVSGTESTATTAATAPQSTAPPVPPFAASIETVTAEQLGSSWRPGCPLGVEQLRAVNVSHWGYDGAVHTGRLVVDGAHAERMVAAFRDIYEARFPVQQIVPVDRYGGDDQASMRANNTSAFNCRYVAGTTRWSEHAYGRAVDVNPLVNPYVKGGTVDPPEGALYADRSRTDQGMIHAGDAAVQAFADQGWAWGGYWSNGKDYQHFSASGR
jgi:hypothetical protein